MGRDDHHPFWQNEPKILTLFQSLGNSEIPNIRRASSFSALPIKYFDNADFHIGSMEIFELAVVRRLTRPAGDELMDENGGGPLARQIDVPTTQGRPTLSRLSRRRLA